MQKRMGERALKGNMIVLVSSYKIWISDYFIAFFCILFKDRIVLPLSERHYPVCFLSWLLPVV